MTSHPPLISLPCSLQLSFSWTASSEKGFDFLYYFVDNTLKTSISGIAGWELKTETVGEGTHSAAWCYVKDKSMSEGDDRGIIGGISVKSLRR